MKYKIMMIVIFFLFMAAVPLSFVINNTGTSSYQQQTSEKLEEKPDEKEIILRTASLCRDDFSDEAIKAAAIICRTNAVTIFHESGSTRRAGRLSRMIKLSRAQIAHS